MARDPQVDPERLAKVMRALASPVRLEILRLLRVPHALGDVRLPPRRAEAGKPPTRPMSVANVRRHIAQLVALGVVRSRRLVRGGRPVDHYEVNRPQVFALTEEMRSLGELGGPDVLDGTLPGPVPAVAPRPRGPHVVIVHGLGEGRAFPFEGQGQRRREAWTIGRAASADVRLDYDPFVSLENSRIVADGSGFAVEDVASSRNGTSVNWEPLPKGSRRPLVGGDVVGVGRTLLLFRDGGAPD